MTLPLENNTNRVIHKIASAQLHHDKLKRGILVFAITLATFMMSLVLLLVTGIITEFKNGGNSYTGSYHALVSNITQEQYSRLSADQRIELLGFSASIETIKIGDERLNVFVSNQECLTLNGLSVSAGRLPQQKDEILIEEDYLHNQKIEAGIGDKISFPIKGENDQMEFVISGYLKTGTKGTKRMLYAAMVSMKFFEEVDGWNTYSPSALFRINSDAIKMQDDISDIATQISSKAGIEQPPSINVAYSTLSNPSVFWIALAIGLLTIIMIAGTLIIYCIFYISILNSIKEYGQLRTIGMTAKQIKRLVFKQGLSLTQIAIPNGLTAGIILSYLLIPQGFRFNHLIWVCPVVVVLVCITVCLSIRKPAKIAATVSPIEASRYDTGDNTIHSRSHRKLTPFALARVQLLRYKKKNLLTMSSIVLTGILLLGMSSVLTSVNARDLTLSGFPRGQFFITFSSQEQMKNTTAQIQNSNPFTDEVYRSFCSLPGLKNITEYQDLPVSNDLQSSRSDEVISSFGQEDMKILQSCSLTGTLPDYEGMASKNQLIIGNTKIFQNYFGQQPEVGAHVTLKIFDGKQSKNMKFEIAAILDESKEGNNWDKIDTMLLTVDSMRKIAQSKLIYQYAIQVDDKYEQEAEMEIEQIIKNNPRLEVRTFSSTLAENENFLQGTKLTLAIAIVLIGCFCVMNLLNSILTGIIVRRKEFSLLRSVGMSQKQLFTMVRCEGLITVTIGLTLSTAVGGGIGYTLCRLLKSGLMSYLEYQFPFGVAILYCLIVFLCTLAITEAALKHQSGLSMIELLRK